MLADWLVLLIIVLGSGVPEGTAQLLLAGAVLFTLVPIAAVVLAILGLWEIRRTKRAAQQKGESIQVQGLSQSIGALLLAGALFVPVAVYAAAHIFRAR